MKDRSAAGEMKGAYGMNERWFPEPEGMDDTYASSGEKITSWLARSTNGRAKECRRFLNSCLAHLRPEFAERIRRDLEIRWESAFFELIVARTLQALGAEIAYEVPIASSGRQPDFQAVFPDGEITVEAISPLFDEEAHLEQTTHAGLSKFIEELTPEGVSVWIRSLPDLGPNDSKKSFKEALRNILRPPFEWNEDAPFLTREELLESGLIRLTLYPRKPGFPKISVGPGYGGFSNSVERIVHAVNKKKRQVRGSDRPVILAINASGMSSTFEDFDTALLGSERAFANLEGRIVSQRFVCNGEFSQSQNASPTFAGVLGFIEVGFRSAKDPVLWIHPRFHGCLPAGLLQLQIRQLALVSISAKMPGVLHSLQPSAPTAPNEDGKDV